MSVWESTTYKLDIAKAIYTQLPGKINTILGRTVWPYLHPRGDLCDLTGNDSWEDLADVLSWEVADIDPYDLECVSTLIAGVTTWMVGIHGVYTLIDAVHSGRFHVKAQYNYKLIERRAKALASVLCPSTMITPDAFHAKWERCNPRMMNLARVFEDAAEAWKYYARAFKTHNLTYTEIDQVSYFGEGDRLFYGGSLGSLIVLRGSGIYKQRGIILTRKHLDMLIGSMLRIANLLDYTAREYAHDSKMTECLKRMLDLTITTAFNCKQANVDKVVQALHKARSYVQMRMFETEMETAILEASLEFEKKGLQNVLNLGEYMKCFIQLPKGRWLDLLHVYKWMPPPDFDATYAFTELYEHHMTPRKSALDPGASREMKELWTSIVRERKLNIATAYQRMNNCWPELLALDEGFPTEEALDEWEPFGLFPYYTYGRDVTAQIKDKATVLARIDKEISTKANDHDKNFLLWFLKNKGQIDTTEIAKQALRGTLAEDNYVRVAYKGEAHKPGSRLFFMAPPKQRLILGEMEGNISRIASEYPASLQGVDALSRSIKLEKLFSLERSSFAVETEEQYTGYIVTFDLSKFSPKFNPAVLQDLHAFWARVFRYDPIEAYSKFGARSVILHTTNGLVMKYKNAGADLEGFRGRMMTLFHADLIAAACRCAKDRGYIVGKSHSAVFIDDGAVKIAASGTGRVARRNALRFLETMQKVYEAAGQENHPNKTIVSAIGGELLAEQYLYGQRIKCAIKAGMRLFPSYELPATAITEEFDAIFSTAQGSIKDGADWVCAYRRLADAYMKAIYRWGRKEFAILSEVRFAFKMVTPKSMGGFGFPTLQALTTTTAYDMTVEGLGILSAAAKMYAVYEEEVRIILGRSVVVRQPIQIFRDPGRVRLVGDILVEGRLSNAIIKKLSEHEGPWTSFIGLAKDAELLGHADTVARDLLDRDTVSLPLMKRAWDCIPLSYIEGLVLKFQRAASVQALLTTKEINTIRRANQRDVATLLKSYF
jgi:hypothetical protein